MEKLNNIMDRFIEVEDDICSFEAVLRVLEEFYDVAEKQEMRAVLRVIERQLHSVQSEFAEVIAEMDKYIDTHK